MMNWRYRLICWLGFHKWTYGQRGIDLDGRRCLRCGWRDYDGAGLENQDQ